jgi:hypothetical protein
MPNTLLLQYNPSYIFRLKSSRLQIVTIIYTEKYVNYKPYNFT